MLGFITAIALAPLLVMVFGLAIALVLSIAVFVYMLRILIDEVRQVIIEIAGSRRPQTNKQKYFNKEKKIRNKTNEDNLDKDAS